MQKDKTFSLVTTTIRVPELLKEYAADAKKNKRNIEQFIVAGDRKSPPETYDFCRALEQDYQVKCVYLGVKEQEDFLRNFPRLKDFLPWNSIERRNVGLLFAYQGKADVVITIDDDNFISENDYFGGQSVVGGEREIEAVNAQNGWFNACEMLEEEHGLKIYPRGFPLCKRWQEPKDNLSFKKIRGRIAVNSGLWLGSPDVDAITNLFAPVSVVKTSSLFRRQLACAKDVWAPFNSQNTALIREALPAYFLLPYIGRYDDIWASYIFRYIADYFNDYISFGSPLVEQKRNPHNYFNDFDGERMLEHNETFLEALKSCRLSASTYQQAYSEIARQFPEKITAVCGNKNIDVHLFDKVAEGLAVWANVFK